MAAPGYSKILLYGSTLPGTVPQATNLETGLFGVELAVNAVDGKLYFKNTSGVVTLLANSAFTDPSAVAITGGSINGVVLGDTNPAAVTTTALTIEGSSPLTINSDPGVAGYVLTSAGPNAAPTWVAASASVGGRTHYLHEQPIAASEWVIVHNLGRYPSVTVVDSAGDECIGSVNHTSPNQVVISFSAAFSGRAFLN